MQALILLLKNIGVIIKLVEALNENIKKSEEGRKVKDDIKKITQAFKEQDAQALHDIFNTTSDK